MNDDADGFIRFAAETSTLAAMSVRDVDEKSWVVPAVSQLRECVTKGEWIISHRSLK